MKYKNNENLFTFGYLPLTYWKNWFSNIKQFFRNIKYIIQRGYKGYADCDLWSIDCFLSNILSNMLYELSLNHLGYPFNIDDTEMTDNDWTAILQEMAEHFHNTLEWEEDIPINQEIMKAYDEMTSHIVGHIEHHDPDKCIFKVEDIHDDENAWQVASKKWLKLENKAAKFRAQEKDKACELLKKWYFNLWD